MSYFSGFLLLLLTACSSLPVLQMEAERPPWDDSVVSPALASGKYKKIMILPPPGTGRGQYDLLLNLFERELLRSGIMVVSTDTVARVLFDLDEKKKAALLRNLSEMERAVVLARRSGADALLQIGEWRWSDEVVPRRFFVFESSRKEKTYREVGRSEYQTVKGAKIAFPSPELKFVGRLISTENGEVLASFNVTSSANFNLPGRYVASVETHETQPKVTAESFSYAAGTWLSDAKRATEASVIRSVSAHIGNSRREDPSFIVPSGDAPTITY